MSKKKFLASKLVLVFRPIRFEVYRPRYGQYGGEILPLERRIPKKSEIWAPAFCLEALGNTYKISAMDQKSETPTGWGPQIDEFLS